jgi:osmotically-inducible protein OsmY
MGESAHGVARSSGWPPEGVQPLPRRRLARGVGAVFALTAGRETDMRSPRLRAELASVPAATFRGTRLPGAPLAGSLELTYTERDRAAREAVSARLRRYLFFTIFDDVQVEVLEGIATLVGQVTSPYKAEAIEELASRVEGVERVVDRLERLPLSGFDDQIRYGTAFGIYSDPLFRSYAIDGSPPVHILVKHGRVRLTGLVMSDVERRRAEQIARSTFGVLSVENALRVLRKD